MSIMPSAVTRRTIARERAGRQRPGETDEEYEARIASYMEPADRPMPLTSDAAAAAAARKQRAGVRE
jgi:hypothetical protein